jgi:hypothetical protein
MRVDSLFGVEPREAVMAWIADRLGIRLLVEIELDSLEFGIREDVRMRKECGLQRETRAFDASRLQWRIQSHDLAHAFAQRGFRAIIVQI